MSTAATPSFQSPSSVPRTCHIRCMGLVGGPTTAVIGQTPVTPSGSQSSDGHRILRVRAIERWPEGLLSTCWSDQSPAFSITRLNTYRKTCIKPNIGINTNANQNLTITPKLPPRILSNEDHYNFEARKRNYHCVHRTISLRDHCLRKIRQGRTIIALTYPWRRCAHC